MTGRPAPPGHLVAATMVSDPERVCRLELASLPTAAPLATLHTADVLTAWGLPQVAETAQVLVFELVTNAVRPAGRPLGAAVEAHHCPACNRPLGRPTYADLRDARRIVLTLVKARGSLLIEVYDLHPRPPVAGDAAAPEDPGRDLHLVTALSRTWSHYEPSEGGSVVWVELAVPEPEPRTVALPPWPGTQPEHGRSVPTMDDRRTLARVRDALRRLDEDEENSESG